MDRLQRPSVVASACHCVNTFSNTIGNFTHEYLTSGRFDFNVTNNDKVFVRLQEDVGTQATAHRPDQPDLQRHSAISLNIRARSAGIVRSDKRRQQPAVCGSVLSGHLRSRQSATRLWRHFPTTVHVERRLVDDRSAVDDYIWPQGRNVTGYQIVDDYSYNLNCKAHSEAGTLLPSQPDQRPRLRRFHQRLGPSAELGRLLLWWRGTGATGGGTTCWCRTSRRRSISPSSCISSAGMCRMRWKATSNLKLTFALRMDHNSVPSAAPTASRASAGSFASVADPDWHGSLQPVDQDRAEVRLSLALPKLRSSPALVSPGHRPRLKNTVFRGGIGIFMDTFPGQIADALSSNTPVLNAFTVLPAAISPRRETGAWATYFQVAVVRLECCTAHRIRCGRALWQSIQAADPLRSLLRASPTRGISWLQPPQNGTSKSSKESETTLSFTINYVGNHGIHETVRSTVLTDSAPSDSLEPVPLPEWLRQACQLPLRIRASPDVNQIRHRRRSPTTTV